MSNVDGLSEIKSTFAALSPDRKCVFLVTLAQEITIAARGAYSEQEGLAKLIGFNEVQHLIAGQLAKMLARDNSRYPDDVFVDIIIEKAQSASCEKALLTALMFSFRQASAFSDD